MAEQGDKKKAKSDKTKEKHVTPKAKKAQKWDNESGIEGRWKGVHHQPCSVEWKEAVKHAKQFAEFDVAAVKDKLLPVREEVQRDKLLLRLFEGKGPVVQWTPKMFQ